MFMNIINRVAIVLTATLLGLSALGFVVGSSAHAETEGDYKLIYQKLCGEDIACTTFNYCTGCHRGLVVGTTIIDEGKMKPAPGNYDEWFSRLQRMSVIGCHIPSALMPKMAAYLDSLDNAPLTKKAIAKAKAEAAAKAKAAAENPGKSNVEFYCVGCHDGLVVGTTVIGGGSRKVEPKTYDEWVEIINKMSERPSGAGAHIPPALIPAMATYLDGLDNPKAESPAKK